MTAKHTPEEWQVNFDPSDDEYIEINDNVGDPIAVVHAGGVRSIDEDQINARLIAAAPEMLATLETVYQDIELQNVKGGTDELNLMVQAAIRKARGKP